MVSQEFLQIGRKMEEEKVSKGESDGEEERKERTYRRRKRNT